MAINISVPASTILSTMSSNPTTKKGSLTIAGSGIASVGHITLETLSHIQEADKIHYLVTDPVTEAFIRNRSKADCVELSVYYGESKNRYETYVQMSEVTLFLVYDTCPIANKPRR